VALRVDAPGAEVRAEPFRWDRLVALTGKFADLIEAFPGVLLAFESFDPLGLGFLPCSAHQFVSLPPRQAATAENKKAHSPSLPLASGLCSDRSWSKLLSQPCSRARRRAYATTTTTTNASVL